MNQSKTEDNTPIHVIGSKSLHSELLASFINRTFKNICTVHHNTSKLGHISGNSTMPSYILWDCLNIPATMIWTQFIAWKLSANPENNIVLINIKSDVEFELEALSRGIKGVFYENDSLLILEKGIHALLNGELWFSREILSKSLREAQKKSKAYNTRHPSTLTHREKEILTMIASGYVNSVISENLCISPHTVKTHINNIYSKIKAPNRVQAVLWAAKNL